MNGRILAIQLAAALLVAGVVADSSDAQQGPLRFECSGHVSGIVTQAVLEITPAGPYSEDPGVAGRIRNQFADYLFGGTLFGGTEGFVSLVEVRTGARIDRVWIGVNQLGFALRTEDGSMYAFRCRR